MKPNVGRVNLGGLVGTIVLTMLIYVGAPMMGIAKPCASSTTLPES